MNNAFWSKKNLGIYNLIWQVDIVWERWSFMHFQQLYVFFEESDKARSRNVKVGCLEGVSVSRRVWSVRQVWVDLRGTGVYFIIYSVTAHWIEWQKKHTRKEGSKECNQKWELRRDPERLWKEDRDAWRAIMVQSLGSSKVKVKALPHISFKIYVKVKQTCPQFNTWLENKYSSE